METKNNRNVFIIALIVLILGFFLGIFMSYILKSDSKVNNSNNIVYYDTYDKKVISLIENIGASTFWIEDIYYKDNSVKVSDLNNEDVYNIVLSNMYEERYNSGETTDIEKITKEEFQTKLESLFGKGYEFEYKTYSGCPMYTYENELFKYSSNECGVGTTGFSSLNPIIKAYKNNDKIVIYVKHLFIGDFENDIYSLYADASLNELVGYYNPSEQYFFDSNDDAISEYDIYGDAATYKFVFTLENNNYVFNSVEPVTE